MKFATKAIHAGLEPDTSTGAIMTPVYQTSTYVQTAPGKHKGYEYSRTQNPTRTALQKNLAVLENGSHCLCFASGMAATGAVIKLFNPGDEIIANNDLYGGTYRIFKNVYEKYGLRFRFINTENPKQIEKHISPKTKMIWIETPSNPLLNITDIAACSAIAKKHKAWLAVDNTFASPYLQNPLDLGADIVVHSLTKYISGHSDLVMGAAICNDESLFLRLAFIQNSCGGVPGPMDCFLALRGIKTLHLRMERHCENGKAVANFLRKHPKVKKVYWPGFTDHPNHKIAKKQMRDFGGMLSFTTKDDNIKSARRIVSGTKIIKLAESLGGVESLIGHPATMTHVAIPKEEREKSGVTDSLIRLSIGVEDVADIIEDLGNALG